MSFASDRRYLPCLGDHSMGMTARKTADVLNEMLALDNSATAGLFSRFVPCNEALAEHPTVQVRKLCDNTIVGLLGVLNGILLRGQSEDVVVAVWDDCEDLIRFETKPYSECFK